MWAESLGAVERALTVQFLGEHIFEEREGIVLGPMPGSEGPLSVLRDAVL